MNADQLIEAVIGDIDIGGVGVDGAEGTVLSWDALLGEDVEEGTFLTLGGPTIPIFRLLPGRPSNTVYAAASCFLGPLYCLCFWR